VSTQDAVLTRVRRANDRFYRAFESLDIKQMEAMWVQTDRAKCIHPGWELLEGWDAVRQSWAAIFANTAFMRFVITDVSVHLYGHVAWVTCLENLTDAVESTQISRVLATNIYEQNTDEDWYIVHHHGSPILRPRRTSAEPDREFLN
jgi:ketosteroid isomerase-like protein